MVDSGGLVEGADATFCCRRLLARVKADASSSLAHSLETEVTVFAQLCKSGIYAEAILVHANRPILRIAQADFQSIAVRVRTGIANRLIGK